MHESSGRFQSRGQNLQNYFRRSDLAESTELFCDLFVSAWGEGGEYLILCVCVFYCVWGESKELLRLLIVFEEEARIICVFLFVLEKKDFDENSDESA